MSPVPQAVAQKVRRQIPRPCRIQVNPGMDVRNVLKIKINKWAGHVNIASANSVTCAVHALRTGICTIRSEEEEEIAIKKCLFCTGYMWADRHAKLSRKSRQRELCEKPWQKCSPTNIEHLNPWTLGDHSHDFKVFLLILFTEMQSKNRKHNRIKPSEPAIGEVFASNKQCLPSFSILQESSVHIHEEF